MSYNYMKVPIFVANGTVCHMKQSSHVNRFQGGNTEGYLNF